MTRTPGGPRRRAAPALLLAAAALAAPGTAGALPRGADGRRLVQAATALEALRLEDARRALAPLVAAHPDDPDVLAQWALLLFHEARYDEAVEAAERATARGAADRGGLFPILRATREATRGFVEARSADGRYVVAHAPGVDAVLVPWALEALAAADAALSAELGVRAPGPIRLEIFPTPAALAAVSALSVEDIERTGTIALAKWDRLMVTSPRALLRGYPWLDTVSHELVHLLVSRATGDAAPVWLQEGLAKFLERRWREPTPAADLDPASAGLLVEAAREGRLIPFEDLHPSIARLPSQRDAALAFAQVATFVESFYARHGSQGVREALRRVARGDDARDALANVSGARFDALEQRWKAEVRARGLDPDEAPPLRRLRFGRAEPSEADEAAEVEVERARTHLRLGDLLWDRGRSAAAEAEYAKAHAFAPDDPIVGARLARAALAAGHADQALAAVEPLVERYPEHAPLHALVGEAHAARGDAARAERAFVRAVRLNPFDPTPHCGLASVARESDLAARGRDACRALRAY